MTNNIAAIDLGSNSARLVIANKKGEYILREAKSARLSQGMVANMMLTEESQARTIEILKDFAKKIKEHNVIKYRAITTAAVRQSKNGQEFVKKVEEQTGIKLEVIDETEEARLNLVGAMAHSYGKSKYVCVFDIGGASTEITIATNENNPKIIQSTSIPLGGRNSAEKYNITEYNQSSAQELISETKQYTKGFSLPQDCIIIGTSSSSLRFASVIYNHKEYIRENCDGLTLSQTQINDTAQKIYNMKREEMAQNPNIGENRSYVFVAAVLLLQTITNELKAPQIIASLQSAKDAIIKELIND